MRVFVEALLGSWGYIYLINQQALCPGGTAQGPALQYIPLDVLVSNIANYAYQQYFADESWTSDIEGNVCIITFYLCDLVLASSTPTFDIPPAEQRCLTKGGN